MAVMPGIKESKRQVKFVTVAGKLTVSITNNTLRQERHRVFITALLT
jgi:hypothetical protein